jgi:hypothetical protein
MWSASAPSPNRKRCSPTTNTNRKRGSFDKSVSSWRLRFRPGQLLEPAIAIVHEAGGITLIVSQAQALQRGLPVLFRCAWITLSVHSDLNAVGLCFEWKRAHHPAQYGVRRHPQRLAEPIRALFLFPCCLT